MKDKKIKILAIETSCDETAAAVISNVIPDLVGDPVLVDSRLRGNDSRPVILSNIISSQIDLHAKTGGIVPEVASRAHLEAIIPVVVESLIQSQNEIPNSNFQKANQESNSNVQLDVRKLNGGRILDIENYQQAVTLLDGVTHIAVTAGPGLIGSLLVGFNAAKTLAYARELPIIPINHIEGHIYSALSGIELPITNYQLPNKVSNDQINNKITKCKNDEIFPILALTVSGGHTSLTLMKAHGEYQILGETLDDAVGEAYDKVAKLLGLGYPGGPEISKLASQFRDKYQVSNIKYQELKLLFPRPIINDNSLNFSLSGLKTAVLQKVLELKKNVISNDNEKSHEISRLKLIARNDINNIKIPIDTKREIAFAFEEAVADVLASKTLKAVKLHQPKTVIFAGGVSANNYLCERLDSRLSTLDPRPVFLVPPKKLTGDNAAMIGLAAYYHIKRQDTKSWSEIKVDSNLSLS